jgi:hypothetical protein
LTLFDSSKRNQNETGSFFGIWKEEKCLIQKNLINLII